MPHVGYRGYDGPPEFAAVFHRDPTTAFEIDAQMTDICLDCCEAAREPMNLGFWRYVSLLCECLACGCPLSDCAIVLPDFVGPTRRGGAAPYEPVRTGAARTLKVPCACCDGTGEVEVPGHVFELSCVRCSGSGKVPPMGAVLR